jgi:hypothetical protein
VSFLWTSPAWSWPLLLVVAVGAVILTSRFYDQSRPGPSPGLRRVLVILRSTAFLLLVFAIAGPILSRVFEQTAPGQLVFLLEDSASMSLEGHSPGTNRWHQSLQTIDEVEKALNDRGLNVNTRLFRGNGLNELQEFESSDPVIPDPLAHGTHLDQFLNRAGTRLAADPVRAVVLLSDGQETGRPQRATASRSQWTGADLFIAGVGDPEGISDRLIKDLRYPETAFQGDRVTVETTILHRFTEADASSTLTAWLRDGEKIVAETTVPIGPGTTNIELSFVPDEIGLKMLELEVSPLDNERFLANNRVSLGVDVHKARARVLVLAERPGWNVRFLAQAAERENRLQLEVVYAAEKGLVYADSLNPFVEPSTVLEWLDFEALILAGYIGAASNLDYSLLSEAVQAGLGLLVLPDPMEASTGFLRPPPGLRELLPVVLEQNQWKHGLLFARPDSLAYEHPVFSGLVQPLGGNPFAESPPLSAAVQCRPVEGSKTLLRALHNVTDEATGVPLLVVRNQARGRVAFWSGSRLWEMAFWDKARAGRDEQEWHPVRRLVRNLLVWLADGSSESGLSFVGRRAFYQEGETIHLAARWRDLRGNPVADGRLNLEIRETGAARPNAEIRNFPVNTYDPIRGEYEFQLPAMPPGRYSVRLLGQGDPVVEGPEEELVITSHSVEQTQVRQDSRRLQQLAERIGARYVNLHNDSGPAGLISQLESLDWAGLQVRNRRSWDPAAGWPFLLTMVLLLACEWFLRRRHGLL